MAKSHKNMESPKSSAKQNVEIQQVPSTYNWGDSFILFDFCWDLNCYTVPYHRWGQHIAALGSFLCCRSALQRRPQLSCSSWVTVTDGSNVWSLTPGTRKVSMNIYTDTSHLHSICIANVLYMCFIYTLKYWRHHVPHLQSLGVRFQYLRQLSWDSCILESTCPACCA